MVRNSGKRMRNRRGGNSSRRNTRRSVRATKARPAARTSLRNVPASNVGTTLLRRFYWIPKKLVAEGSTDKTWWIEALAGFGTVVMKLLATLITAPYLDSFHKQLGLEPNTYQAMAVPTGCVMRAGYSIEDLLAVSNFANEAPLSPGVTYNHCETRYRQGKLEWMRIVVTPQSTLVNRGGTLYLSLRSFAVGQAADDWARRAFQKPTIREMIASGGITVQSATRPASVTYSPSIGDPGYGWVSIGQQESPGIPSAGTPDRPFYLGGSPVVMFTMGYCDPSSNTKDLSEEYSMLEATFEVAVEARIRLRQTDDVIYIRASPPMFFDSDVVSVDDGRKAVNVPFDKIRIHSGVMCLQPTVAPPATPTSGITSQLNNFEMI